MARISYKNKWRDEVNSDIESFLDLSDRDPFEDWENNRMPDSSAAEELILAMDLICADVRPKLATHFLTRCVAICERAAMENKPESDLCKNSFPLNRGHLLRYEMYAQALLGKSLNISKCRQASTDISDYCDLLGGLWDAQIQSYYLGAIRLALLSSDVALARKMLLAKKGFPEHRTEAGILQHVLTEKGNKASQQKEITIFFDHIRDPDFRPGIFTEVEILRLEISAIRESLKNPKEWSHDFWKLVQAISS